MGIVVGDTFANHTTRNPNIETLYILPKDRNICIVERRASIMIGKVSPITVPRTPPQPSS